MDENRIKYIKKSDIMGIPKLKMNPIANILVKKYSVDSKIFLDDLLNDLTKFMNSNNLDEKLQFIFDIYDVDSDGMISSNELFELLKQLNSNEMENWKLQNIVDKTFAEIEEYTTQINFEQFKLIIKKRSQHLKKIFDCVE